MVESSENIRREDADFSNGDDKSEPAEDENDSEEGGEEEDDDDDYDDDEAEEDEVDDGDDGRVRSSVVSRLCSERAKMENLFRRLSSERVTLTVHDVLIRGNTKTNDSVIEAEIEALRRASTLQELLQAATAANTRLHGLELFDSVNITLDAGPPELHGTDNVVVEVSEAKNPLTGNIGVFTKPEVH